MKKEVCNISLTKDCLDNDYTFYSDGTVFNIYDKQHTKKNIITELMANALSPETKKKLLEKCPIEKIEAIINLMSTNQSISIYGIDRKKIIWDGSEGFN